MLHYPAWPFFDLPTVHCLTLLFTAELNAWTLPKKMVSCMCRSQVCILSHCSRLINRKHNQPKLLLVACRYIRGRERQNKELKITLRKQCHNKMYLSCTVDLPILLQLVLMRRIAWKHSHFMSNYRIINHISGNKRVNLTTATFGFACRIEWFVGQRMKQEPQGSVWW